MVWTPAKLPFYRRNKLRFIKLNSNLGESEIAAEIKSAVNWANNGPFDKEVDAIQANDLKIKCQINAIYFLSHPSTVFYR